MANETTAPHHDDLIMRLAGTVESTGLADAPKAGSGGGHGGDFAPRPEVVYAFGRRRTSRRESVTSL